MKSEKANVIFIEQDCLDLLNTMNERLEEAKKNFEEWDDVDDMHLIDQMKTAIQYMNEMLSIIQYYKTE